MSKHRPAKAQTLALDRLLLQAVLAYRADRMDEAETVCRQIMAVEQRHAPATLLLGMIAGRTGRRTLAIELLRKAVALDPQSVDARNTLAANLQADGNQAEAIALWRQAIRLKPDDAGAHDNLGVACLDERKLPEALACFEEAVALEPDVAAHHYHLGIALQRAGRDIDAATCYSKALRLDADFADAEARLGSVALLQGDPTVANAYFRHAAEQASTAPGKIQVAAVLAEIGQVAVAADCLREATALDPLAADAHARLGSLQQQQGRFDEATASFERVLALQPRNADACLGIVTARKIAPSDQALLDRITSVLTDAVLPEQDRATLHYALGKACDDLSNYEQAMRHFDQANRISAARLKRAGRTIDKKSHAANVDRMIASFTKDLFDRYRSLGSSSELPILIVGMIRSGTTLVEQIVSSHPEVAAGGELRYWGEKGKEQGDAAAGTLGASEAHRLVDGYCRVLRAGASHAAQRVTDKMPTNFFLLGLIHLLLPRARIIHCRRDPADTGLSIYCTPFPRSPDYGHDRGNIVFYYEQYARLMAHWRSVLPADRLFEVDYEALVDDREQMTPRLIDFCGLDWNDECLRHDRNAQVIRTPSAWQARQPVYTRSVARWRHYEPWLGELRRLVRNAP
ncbi:MAG: sulfotransferase [Betaproteobacteria bacterium]